MEVALPILFIGVLIFLAHLLSALFARTQVPDVLFLIGIGVIVGPVLKLVTPEDFGVVGPIFSTVALVVILFEGGIDLKLNVIRRSMQGAVVLTIVGFLVTIGGVSVVARLLMDFNWFQAILLAGILAAISPAVVIPLARQLRMTEHSRTMVCLESAISDVLCIVLTLELIASFQAGGIQIGSLVSGTVTAFIFAFAVGGIGALIWAAFLKQVRAIENTNFTTLAVVFIVYGVTEWMGFSGPIAALVFGFTLGNIHFIRLPLIYRFIARGQLGLNEAEKTLFTEVVFILKTFFFVYVGMSVLVYDTLWIIYGAVLTSVVFLLRIPVVRLTLSKLTEPREAGLIAIMVPKGLATAVMASLPAHFGVPGGELMQSISYTVILISIVTTAVLSFLITRTPVSRVYGLFFYGFGQRASDSQDGLEQVSESVDR